ncbi:MAG TPA: MazG nucleotide pyrophosphohydrolase domain-containing protein [Candidatus Binatia bacterium]|nr:MazG nucleotide pyrophosphohydrolase domain-containing protein [Candidatus Binatia bacterium]
MPLNIQEDVEKWFKTNKFSYWTPDQILTKLDEESGELSSELNSRFGPNKKKPADETREIGHELSDVLFALTCFANSHKIDLTTAFLTVRPHYTNGNGVGTIETLKDLQRQMGSLRIAYHDPLKMNREIIIMKGRFAEVLKNKEQYQTGNVTERVGDLLVSTVALAHVQNIDLSKAWDEKMSIRYGRDKGRFEQKL